LPTDSRWGADAKPGSGAKPGVIAAAAAAVAGCAVVNVLIVKPSSFGDVLHTFPAVDLLRRTLPEARITWVVNEELADLVELCPAVERVILFPRQKLRNWSSSMPWTSRG
jgi:hypothetical protein